MTRLWFNSALLGEGWARDVRLTLDAGRIARVEAGVRPAPGDEHHGHAVPGLPNLHSHAFQRAMAGLAERRGPGEDSFWTWREAMYRFVDRLTPDDVEAVAAQAFAEMLEAGFTRVGEFHYLHHGPDGRPYGDVAEMAARVAAAANHAGIGLTLLPVFYAHGGFGGAAPAPGQRRFVNDLDGFARLLEASRRAVAGCEGAVVGLAPHSLRAVTPEELAHLIPLAGGPVHIHVAEQAREVEECLAHHGARPVRWLLDHAPVDGRWCLIHATHTTEAELAGVAGRGAVVGLCPVTEANLGDGVFDARTFLGHGGAFGVGTDSNVRIDAAEELRLLEYGQRLTRRARNVLATEARASTGRALFDAAQAGGARALGAEAGIVAGRPADIVGLDAGHPALVAREGDALLDGWVFAARPGAIDAVWRGGRRVVAGGRHVGCEAIEGRFRGVMRHALSGQAGESG